LIDEIEAYCRPR